MHELSIAQEIIRIITEEKDRNNFKKVHSVKLNAGAFSGVDGHALRFAFEVVREGTCAAQAQLLIETEPMKVVCRRCGCSMPADNGPQRCADCASLDVGLEGTMGFEITSLEVD